MHPMFGICPRLLLLKCQSPLSEREWLVMEKLGIVAVRLPKAMFVFKGPSTHIRLCILAGQ